MNPKPMKLALVATLLFTSFVTAGERKSLTNHSYGSHARQKLDVYWNTDFDNAPIIVNIHGGGWQNGDKKGFGSAPIQKFVVDELGCVLVSPNYRLVGDLVEGKVTRDTRAQSAGKVDAMMSDVASAVAYVQRHAADYGANPKQVIVCGASAGGHLSAALAYCDERDWLKGTDFAGDQLNIVGWFGDSAPLDKTLNRQIPFNDDAIPILNVDKEDPPGFMIVGTRDRLVPVENSTRFQKVLTDNGIWNQVLICEGGGHVVGKLFVSYDKMKAPFAAFVKFVTGKSEPPESGQTLKFPMPSRS